MSACASQKFSNSLFTRYRVKSPSRECGFFLPRVGEIPGDWSKSMGDCFMLPLASKSPPPRPNIPKFAFLSAFVGLMPRTPIASPILKGFACSTSAAA